MLGVLAALLLAGCQVDTTVSVDVAEDGSGTVTVEVVLDQEATARVPDLAEQLRTRDLRRTGWEIEGPTEAEAGGGVTVVATKEFFEPEQLGVVLAEVGGLTGELSRGRPFGRTTYDFEGTLDLSRGVRTFSDRPLTQLLDGFPIGQDQAQLEAELGAPLRDLSSFTVELSLPEGDQTRVAAWEAALGDEPVELTARTEERNVLVFGLLGGAAAALVLLVLVLLWRLARRNRGPVFARR